MMEIKLKNMRKGPIVGTDIVERSDGELVNQGGTTRFVQPGQVGLFPGANKGVQIYAKAGYLKPVDKDGEDWFKKISKK